MILQPSIIIPSSKIKITPLYSKISAVCKKNQFAQKVILNNKMSFFSLTRLTSKINIFKDMRQK